MPTPIIVTIPHKLGKDRAVERLKGGLLRGAESFPVLKVDEEVWSGDRMTFRVRALGQAAAGTVDVADDNVRFEVTLPWLLERFADLVQGALTTRGRLLLEKK
jgi:hypothetical protein